MLEIDDTVDTQRRAHGRARSLHVDDLVQRLALVVDLLRSLSALLRCEELGESSDPDDTT
jgi:hypothetical protein